MRSPELGVIAGLPEQFGEDFALELYTRGTRARLFELKVKEALERKIIKLPVYLSLGQEFNAAALSLSLKSPQIFPQHRGHSLYLSYGASAEALRDELLGLPSGCAGGMSGSNAIHSPEHGIWGHSGLLGEQIPIAVGSALGSGKVTLAICGDAAVEEDYFNPSIGFAASHKLPILFICEDNGLSILTPISIRRKWSVVNVAASFGIPTVDITDDPWLIAHHIKEMSLQLPALINIRTVRTNWHAGPGCDGPPEWDRFALITDQLNKMGLSKKLSEIMTKNRNEVDWLWHKQLPKQ
jgi:acetoin:2,6-dichlorophenolindophenol oxidoreductase subunit alpha